MKFHLGHILAFFALALAAGAGYISVTGWGKLFAGQATIVMIVMAIIEAAKVITTIYLHKYGKRTKLALKAYLTAGVVATMILTSVGIYGFLTGAYQDTANKMELQNGEVSILEGKKLIFEQKIVDNKENLDTKKNRMNQLTNLRLTQEARLDSLIANNHWQNVTKTRADIDNATAEIQLLGQEVDSIISVNATLADSVSTYQIKILEIEANSSIAAEIGPLKYISTLTGRHMDDIINYLVLIIIFIFDPMAISLVLATNNVFDQNKKKGGDESSGGGNDEPDDDPELEQPMGDVDLVNDEETTNVDEAPIDEPFDEFPVPETKMGVVEEEVEPEPDGEDNIEEEVIEEVIDIPSPQFEIDFDQPIEYKEPEEQIAENRTEIRRLAPVIPTGKVEREEIKEIKERGFSVDVPEPNGGTVEKIGSNKEIRNGNRKVFYFNKPNQL